MGGGGGSNKGLCLSTVLKMDDGNGKMLTCILQAGKNKPFV